MDYGLIRNMRSIFLTCVSKDITIITFVLDEIEPRQMDVWNNLHRILLFPLVNQVVLGPPVCKAQKGENNIK